MIFDVVGVDRVEVEPEVVIVAGFTGRNRELVEQHVAELRGHGVPIPGHLPSFYSVAPTMLTQRSHITVTGLHTSGEAEIALIRIDDRKLVTLASDHTDRAAEAVDIELSKRVCPKPIASVAWDYSEVADRWDQLELASWIREGGEQTLYQSGAAVEILSVTEIEAAIPFKRRPRSYVLLTGTLPAIGPIRASSRFAARLHDPASGRSIDLAYEIAARDDLEAS